MAEIVFGPFTLDLANGRLFRDGCEIKLRPQALQALKVLLLHSGKTISYEQMIAEAWGGTVVSRHTVDVTVAEVRKRLGEQGTWLTNRPKIGYCLDIPKSEELVRKGWHFWNRRTREGFERAIECFEQAASECSADARAFEGLSSSHLMLASFGMRQPRDVYPAFLEAHKKAVALCGLTPELRCNRAHWLHMFEGRLAEAECEFRETLRERPALTLAYVRKAMLYVTLGRLDGALQVIEQAYKADALHPTLPVIEIAVRFWHHDVDGAISVGARTVELHPYLQMARSIYAQALEFAGRLDDALVQYQVGAAMSPDLPWLRALEGACLAKQRRVPEARAILEELDGLRSSKYVDAYMMAVLRAAVGERAEALDELERAFEERSRCLYAFNVDPKMDQFKGDPRFAQLCREREARRRRQTAAGEAERTYDPV